MTFNQALRNLTRTYQILTQSITCLNILNCRWATYKEQNNNKRKDILKQ